MKSTGKFNFCIPILIQSTRISDDVIFFEFRLIQINSKLSSVTSTNPDRIISKLVDATLEAQNTCTFLPTKRLRGLRREHLACILSRPHKVINLPLLSGMNFSQNAFINYKNEFHNFRFDFSLHHLLVRGANNARTGCDSYRKVRRLFDSSRLLNQARSFLSRKCTFKFHSHRLSLFVYDTSCTSL